jgi:hypothetical protein
MVETCFSDERTLYLTTECTESTEFFGFLRSRESIRRFSTPALAGVPGDCVDEKEKSAKSMQSAAE